MSAVECVLLSESNPHPPGRDTTGGTQTDHVASLSTSPPRSATPHHPSGPRVFSSSSSSSPSFDDVLRLPCCPVVVTRFPSSRPPPSTSTRLPPSPVRLISSSPSLALLPLLCTPTQPYKHSFIPPPPPPPATPQTQCLRESRLVGCNHIAPTPTPTPTSHHTILTRLDSLLAVLPTLRPLASLSFRPSRPRPRRPSANQSTGRPLLAIYITLPRQQPSFVN